MYAALCYEDKNQDLIDSEYFELYIFICVML